MLFLDTLAGLLAQISPPGGEAADTATSTSSGGGMFQYLLPFMVIMLLVMLLTRPRRGDAEAAERIKSLKKNDRVVTAGGIIGTVMSIREDTNYVTLRIDEASNTKMQILKTSIAKVLEGSEKTSSDS